MRISTAVLVPALIAVVAVVATVQIREDAIQTTRTTYYAQGVSDGVTRAQQATKAPAPVQTMVQGFCSGTLELAWFDQTMNVTQTDVDAYAAKPHDCAGVRFLGALAVTGYTGEQGTSYIFVISMNGKDTWWVFTVNAAGKIVDIQ